ncbi:MAG: prepilin-type N-terminal cleavage/methylation domain-containing protein [Candidatus Omnitrophica bacterium]|nr:prepilin-type N-terminal cleavage/methylation domain-containing protein [Candidatus Omnitrophota bacterium]
MRHKALTFIELLVVIIIIGMLAGLAFPNLRRSFNSAQTEEFSRQLQFTMNYLRDKSVVEQKVIFLSFDPQGKSYSAWFQAQNLMFKTYSLPAGIDIRISKKSNPDDPAVYFYPDGRIDAVDIGIACAGKSIILTTEGVFGKVKIKQ